MNPRQKIENKKVPFYYALLTCIFAFISIYFFSSAIITLTHNGIAEANIEFLKAEISFRDFVLGENKHEYTKDYVKRHFETNLNPVQLKHAASKHWSYYITVNGKTASSDIVTTEGDKITIEITQVQKEPLFDEKYHSTGSVTGGDSSDKLSTHVKITSPHSYSMREETLHVVDEDTNEKLKIIKYIYEVTIEKYPDKSLDESLDKSRNIISISYSPIFLNTGLKEGVFPEKIYFVNN